MRRPEFMLNVAQIPILGQALLLNALESLQYTKPDYTAHVVRLTFRLPSRAALKLVPHADRVSRPIPTQMRPHNPATYSPSA